MPYIFRTPTILEEMDGEYHPLFSRIKIQKGITVLKNGSTYRQIRYPSSEEWTAATIAYLGGIDYEVDATEKAALEAAGYTVDTI
jgi:hypothetical protein